MDLLGLVAARKGHFLLESGHHGELWLDLDTLFARPGRLLPHIAELAARLGRHRPAVVCGPLVGGAFVAQAVATSLDAEFAFAERIAAGGAVEYRIPAGLRALVRDRPVAVADDAINAGSAVRATTLALRECGAEVVAIGALLLLGSAAPEHFAASGMPLESVAALPNQIWEPALCPRCAAGEPLDRIG